jgi:hypothetical protein
MAGAERAGRPRGGRALAMLGAIAPALLLTLPSANLAREEASQVRYEEMAESIRGPVWLEHRAVYDGTSTNVAWYALLLSVYKIFGFDLSTASWARVALLAGSLTALSVLLRRHLAPLPAMAALAAFALSPTLLFLNRITTSYGTDLLMLPLCALLLDETWRRSRAPGSAGSLAGAAGLGAATMLGAMIYPAFVPAIPCLTVWLAASTPPGRRLAHLAAAAGGFLAPLGAGALALREPATLFWDPLQGTGVLRGGAPGAVGEWSGLRANLAVLVEDLFRDGSSYYFELHAVEFGGWLGRAGFAATLALAIVTAWRARETRALLGTALVAALVAVLAASAAGGPPGIRRATVALAAFYLVVAVLWAASRRSSSRGWARAAAAGVLLLMPIHHAIAYFDHLEQARRPVHGRERVWLNVAGTPQASLDHWVAHVDAGNPLDCRTRVTPGKQLCRYDYIYSAVWGARRWNGAAPPEIRAIDPRDGSTVVLDPEHWREREIPASSQPRARRRAS